VLLRQLALFLFTGALLSAAPISSTATATFGGGRGPYRLAVNGHNFVGLCLDDEHMAYGTWTANVTSLSSAGLQNTYLGASGMTQYEEAAYLYTLLSSPGANQWSIQQAAWATTDAVYLASLQQGASTGNTGYAAALAYYNQAADPRNYGSLNWADFDIVSDVNRADSNREQEFIIGDPGNTLASPEPGTSALLSCALIAAGLLSRRKKLI
jgi:hypothetical protein